MPGKFIDCGLNCTEGAISPTGDIIVVYDSYRKSMIVYNIVDIIQSWKIIDVIKRFIDL